MKIKSIPIAIVGCASVLLSSCVTDAGVWGASVGYSAPGFSSSVAWTNASYDVNGFPIYGYAYGRPVYGYTAAGAAIFSIAALTAWCYVPDWGPAPWYHGVHRYPHHCHRAPAPPKFAPGHHPGRRPSGGMNAPIHKNPSSVLGKPLGHSGKPNHHGAVPGKHTPGNSLGFRPDNSRLNTNVGTRPNVNRPNINAGARPNVNRPNINAGARPNVNRPNINAGARPSVNRPNINAGARPNVNRPNINAGARSSVNRPNINAGARPSVNRPNINAGARPSVNRPNINAGARPSVNRPNINAGARPSKGGAGQTGGGPRR